MTQKNVHSVPKLIQNSGIQKSTIDDWSNLQQQLLSSKSNDTLRNQISQSYGLASNIARPSSQSSIHLSQTMYGMGTENIYEDKMSRLQGTLSRNGISFYKSEYNQYNEYMFDRPVT